MVSTIKFFDGNWVKAQGLIFPVSEYEYSDAVKNKLIADDIPVWYSNISIQLQNADSINYVHGVNYKTRTFAEYGLNSINDIVDNLNSSSSVLPTMLSDLSENAGALTYTQTFVISESSIIVYDDAYNSTLNKYVIILKDQMLTAKMIGITAKYDGPNVAIGEEIDPSYIDCVANFEDGSTLEIMYPAYSIQRKSDNTISKVIYAVGKNTFKALFDYGENHFEADFSVTGVKKLVGITATYDGPQIAINKTPKKSNFTVVAHYSDGSASTVTDWSFYNGGEITEANNGLLTIYYLGFTCDVNVNFYQTEETQLKAYYYGPKVEKGKDFDPDYLVVKIYYQSTSSTSGHWEVVDPGNYTIDTTHISEEGDNVITVSYTTTNGDVLTTNFIVTGIVPEAYIAYITAEYFGPPIPVNKYYNTNKVKVKAYWSNGNISEVKGFAVTNPKVTVQGDNIITAIYKGKTTTFVVPGLAIEDTTETNYTPTEVQLRYPEASKVNHRYRGPMESIKFTEYAKFIHDNLTTLFTIYNLLEKEYTSIKENEESLFNTSVNVLNTNSIIYDKIQSIKKLVEENNV